jgi:hypothetical protein
MREFLKQGLPGIPPGTAGSVHWIISPKDLNGFVFLMYIFSDLAITRWQDIGPAEEFMAIAWALVTDGRIGVGRRRVSAME